MKVIFWLSVFLIILITGCATTPSISKKEQALRIRKLGEAFLAEQKYAPAYRELMTALKLDPGDAHVHYALGIFFYEKKNYDRAIEEYKKALEIKPDFATARNNLGIVYMALKEWDKAIEILSPLTEDYLYATPHFPHYLIGQAYYQKQDYPMALEHFKQSLELQPDFSFAAHWLGKTCLKMGNPEKAVSALEKAADAMKTTPAAPDFLLDLGRAYALTGQYNKARECFGQAACLATDNQTLKNKILKEQSLLENKASTK